MKEADKDELDASVKKGVSARTYVRRGAGRGRGRRGSSRAGVGGGCRPLRVHARCQGAHAQALKAPDHGRRHAQNCFKEPWSAPQGRHIAWRLRHWQALGRPCRRAADGGSGCRLLTTDRPPRFSPVFSTVAGATPLLTAEARGTIRGRRPREAVSARPPFWACILTVGFRRKCHLTRPIGVRDRHHADQWCQTHKSKLPAKIRAQRR